MAEWRGGVAHTRAGLVPISSERHNRNDLLRISDFADPTYIDAKGLAPRRE